MEDPKIETGIGVTQGHNAGGRKENGKFKGLLKGMRDKNSIQQGPFKFLAWARGNSMTVFIAHWWVGCEWNSKGS